MSTERYKRIVLSIKESKERRDQIRAFLTTVMLENKEKFDLDIETVLHQVQLLRAEDNQRLQFLEACILSDDEVWNVFKLCNSNIDMFFNNNKMVYPNYVKATEFVYDCAKKEFDNQRYVKSMGQYFQGLIMFPTEVKMFSNLILALRKAKMGEIGKAVFQFIIQPMAVVTPFDQAHLLGRATGHAEMIEKEEKQKQKEKDKFETEKQLENQEQKNSQNIQQSNQMLHVQESDKQIEDIQDQQIHHAQEQEDHQEQNQINSSQAVEVQTIEQIQDQQMEILDQQIVYHQQIQQDDIDEYEDVADHFEQPLMGLPMKHKEVVIVYRKFRSEKTQVNLMGKQMFIFKDTKKQNLVNKQHFKDKLLLRMIYAMKKKGLSSVGKSILLKQPKISNLIYNRMKQKKQQIDKRSVNIGLIRKEMQKQQSDEVFKREMNMEYKQLYMSQRSVRIKKLHPAPIQAVRDYINRSNLPKRKFRKNVDLGPYKSNLKLRLWWKTYDGEKDFKEFCDKNPSLTKFYLQDSKGLLTYDEIRQLAVDIGTKQGNNIVKYNQEQRVLQLRVGIKNPYRVQQQQPMRKILNILDKSCITKCLTILLSSKYEHIACSKEMVESMWLMQTHFGEGEPVSLTNLVDLPENVILQISRYI